MPKVFISHAHLDKPTIRAVLSNIPPEISAWITTYTLNSGIFALTEVARGSLSGFVNITTNSWDVAAGEVLIRACGGKITNFHRDPISYKSTDQISVIAARSEQVHEEIVRIIRNR